LKQKSKSSKKNKKTKKIGFFKKFVTGLTLLVAIIILLVGTETGRSILIGYFSSYISNSLQEPVKGEYSDVDDGIGDEVVDVNDSAMGVREEAYVTNYLLLGIEKIDGASNTDAMIIASIDTKTSSIKLTSVLRDTLVNIPGYSQNKLNSVYSKGGAELLIRVIEDNFKIELEGYAMVNFEDFEAVIDKIGGVDIEITKKEAEYLNSTNYISKPENAIRNMYYIGYTSVIAGGEDDAILQYIDWCYGAEDEEEEALVEYPIGYFFGDEESDDYKITTVESQTKRQLFAQYPTKEVMEHCVVMDYFDPEENTRINRMWTNARCFDFRK